MKVQVASTVVTRCILTFFRVDRRWR